MRTSVSFVLDNAPADHEDALNDIMLAVTADKTFLPEGWRLNWFRPGLDGQSPTLFFTAPPSVTEVEKDYVRQKLQALGHISYDYVEATV